MERVKKCVHETYHNSDMQIVFMSPASSFKYLHYTYVVRVPCRSWLFATLSVLFIETCDGGKMKVIPGYNMGFNGMVFSSVFFWMWSRCVQKKEKNTIHCNLLYRIFHSPFSFCPLVPHETSKITWNLPSIDIFCHFEIYTTWMTTLALIQNGKQKSTPTKLQKKWFI